MSPDADNRADVRLVNDSVAPLQPCAYLRAVSTLERLTGFELTAAFFESVTDRCRQGGCKFEWLCLASAHRQEVHEAAVAPVTTLDATRQSGHRIVQGGAETIAFSRSATIDIVTDRSGNHVERRTLKFDALKASSPLTNLYRYWQWLRGATACRLADLDVAQIMRAGIIGRLHVVDVRSSDPGDFCYELIGYAIPFKLPRKPSALPYAICADTAVLDYNTVRMTGAPRLQHVRCRLDEVAHNYTRLIVPLLDQRRRVSHLAIAIERGPGDGARVAPAT